jgi:indole-3-pyruvate monooxygenase
MENVVVLIVGAGPAGLATAACLTQFSIPYVIVEREDCSASLWRNRAYDRLKLHLAKEFCELPHMSYPVDAPTYIPKALFVKYLDDYIMRFNIQPKYLTSVESSTYDNDNKCWSIVARDIVESTTMNFSAKFLVVASGENSAENIPVIPGLDSFPGEAIHSSRYKSGKSFSGKSVLVIGSGNSGMEITYDLATHHANTSIVIRSPVCALYNLFGNNIQCLSIIRTRMLFSWIMQVAKMCDIFLGADSCNDEGTHPLGDDTSPPSSTESSG